MTTNGFRRNLTEIEIPCLPETFNLTDGHAFRSWSEAEARIFSDSARFFFNKNRRHGEELEREYVTEFMRAGGETVVDECAMVCLTASMSIELVANHLRLTGATVGLITPCFDNLADILKRHDIPLVPIPEATTLDPDRLFEEYGDAVDTFFFVNPNNPTGSEIGNAAFKTICERCAQSDKLLIIDNAFRHYKVEHFDQLALVRASGVRYIGIEDTGKTWPSLELKLSILLCTRELHADLYRIYTDFLLHVSTFVLQLLTAMVRLSNQESFATIRGCVRRNREYLRSALSNTGIEFADQPGLSVAWLKLPADLTGERFAEQARKEGVFVLPGNYFFWDDPRQGDRFVRVALLRDSEVFDEAASRLARVAHALLSASCGSAA